MPSRFLNRSSNWQIAVAYLAVSVTVDDSVASEQANSRADTRAHATFVDVAAQVGLDFQHESGVRGQYRLPEIMGSGAALFDYDNDGDLDIYLIDSGGGKSRLFQQGEDGSFRDATGQSGLTNPGYGMGTALGDIDNDGDVDIFVTNVGTDHLYRNDGHGTFTDITATAGIEGSYWSSSAAFCDIDGDGYLDLYVATYVESDPLQTCTNRAGEPDYCPPGAYRSVPDQLFLNNGNGTFKNVSETSGISLAANSGLGVVCFDFSGDHRTDVLVANDGEPNHLWINRGDNTFAESGLAFGVSVNLFGEPEASMGIAFGDVDGDLDLDLLMTHIDSESNTLYVRAQENLLIDATIGANLGFTSVPFTGFGTVFFDADNDGDLDLAIANGRVRKAPGRRHPTGSNDDVDEFVGAYAEKNLMMENSGSGVFRNSCDEPNGFCDAVEVSRGLLAADIDRDGDLDLLVTNSNGSVRLYQNQTTDRMRGGVREGVRKGGAWLQIRAIDPNLNRDAVGAQVRVQIDGRWLVRPVIHTTSYLSSTDATVHFGLGDASGVDAVVVVWADGVQERFPPMKANQLSVIQKGHGIVELRAEHLK